MIWRIGILSLALSLASCDDEESPEAMMGGGPGSSDPSASPADGGQMASQFTSGTSEGASGILITDYGYAGDFTPDSASAAGIGNHDNQLTGYVNGDTVASAAVSDNVAQQLGLHIGQVFNVTSASGDNYTLQYDDTAPENNRIDIYSKSGSLGGNSFSQHAITVTPLTVANFK